MPGLRAAFGVDPEANIGRTVEHRQGPVVHAIELFKGGYQRHQLQRIDQMSAALQLHPGNYGSDTVKLDDEGQVCTITSWCDTDGGMTSQQTIIGITRGDQDELLKVAVSKLNHEDALPPYETAHFAWVCGDPADSSTNSMSFGDVVSQLKRVQRAVDQPA